MGTERVSPPTRSNLNAMPWGAVVLLAGVLAMGIVWRLGASAPVEAPADPAAQGTTAASAGPETSLAPEMQVPLSAIPLPEGTSGTVLDPSTYDGKLLPVDEALRHARASAPNLVGSDPLVRLMHTVTNENLPSEQIDAVAWVFLSRDAWVWISGPHGVDSQADMYIHYGWVFVDMDGSVLMATANSYRQPDSSPPDLPAE